MAEESFHDDELNPPEWLNVQFMTQVLRGYEKDSNLKVINLSFTPASAKGDHYASIMFRARVEYTAQNGNFTKSLIIKTMIVEEGIKKDMFKDSPLFTTEIGMYTKVLPEWERILRRAKDPAKLYVECIFTVYSHIRFSSSTISSRWDMQLCVIVSLHGKKSAVPTPSWPRSMQSV